MSKSSEKAIIGGGTKKVLYTLKTLNRIGLRDSSKALRANNACKACGLGMGGQKGGMTNEEGEFPSVCNKSIQAQSTDIQPPIPEALFAKHPLKDFRALSGYELEHLGRLANPIVKEKGQDKYKPISWDDAFNRIAEKLSQTEPEKSFFYASGRSSNEAGFLLQLIARLYGTNNVNNCSFYCHQATGVALNNTIGSGTATVELHDLKGCDLVFVIGANPASNHPRFIHQLKALRDRGGKVIIINPAKEPGLVRFAVPKSPRSMIFGGTEIASEYLQNHIGSDLILLQGIAKSLLENDQVDKHFIEHHTEEFDELAKELSALEWSDIETITGIAREKIAAIASVYAQSKNTIFAWGMGITHHVNGVENVEAISNLALLRGMIGKPNAGLLPLRGHSNVQGIGTIGVKPILKEDVYEKLEQVVGTKLPRTKGLDTLACLEKAHAGEMQFALCMGGNLFSASPDQTWTEAAFNNIPFKVFLTTTLNHGHTVAAHDNESIVLPVCARDEENEPTTQESMFNYVRLSDGGIHRIDRIKPETEVLANIAKRIFSDLSIDFDAFCRHSSLREAIANSIPGMEQLADIDQTKQEFHIPKRLLHAKQFHTKSGRVKFIAHKHNNLLPPTEFPMRLASVRSEGQFNTIIYEEDDSYRGTKTRWSVLMSRADMQNMDITSGNTINIVSPHGKMSSVIVYPFDIPAGNMLAYFPEANVLIGRDHDPRSQTPAFKNVAVKIEHA